MFTYIKWILKQEKNNLIHGFYNLERKNRNVLKKKITTKESQFNVSKSHIKK